jgi:D-beta-D-heptose 7-phosphate kinase/D-beta-D-heptose 1-phosphate adenosyltransferase
MIAVIGDALLDRDLDGHVERLCPEAPVPVLDDPAERTRPGGAALAAALLARDGRDVVLVTALSADRPGRQLARVIARAGVRVVDLGLDGATPEKVRCRADGHLLLRVDRGGGPGVVGPLSGEAREALVEANVVLVSDYGRGVAERARPALRPGRFVWDPHPRGGAPAPGAALVTPNRAEAGGDDVRTARRLLEQWDAAAVTLTLGRRGALVVDAEGLELHVPAPPVEGGDPCGAGDRFAAAAAGLLTEGAPVADAVAGAVRAASAFVAAGGAGAVGFPAPLGPSSASDAESLAADVRARGGTVVATGGCFDLLHAGHVAVLEAARSLGDCLIVCLNSDDSARRLKGPDRPLVPQEDRAAVLRGLAAVDAVVVFDEDTPEQVLERLRPNVWAKGGDYSLDELPEARVVERWGGRAVILPYVEGRSTTRLIQELQRA